MEILELVSAFLSLSGLATSGAPKDVSVVRLEKGDVNLGLINTEKLSLQVKVIHHQPPRDHDGHGWQIPPVHPASGEIVDNRVAAPVQSSDARASIKVLESPFEMTSTFNFSSTSVFDEKKLVINTIPIHFLRAEDRATCDLKLRRTFSYQPFATRGGRLSMAKGYFSELEPHATTPPRFVSCDKRLDKLTRSDSARLYTDRRSTLVGIFSVNTGRKTPLGKDDAVFSNKIFGTVYLICVATSKHPGPEYRIRSHFYIAIERAGILPK